MNHCNALICQQELKKNKDRTPIQPHKLLMAEMVVMTMHFIHFGNTVPASEIPCTFRTTVSSDRDKTGCGVTQGVGVVALPSLELRPVTEVIPMDEFCT
jgi:hypothetical protein